MGCVDFFNTFVPKKGFDACIAIDDAFDIALAD
jgi:hypothetical protein